MVEWNPQWDGTAMVYNAESAASERTGVLARPVRTVADAGAALALDVRNYGCVDATLTETCTITLTGADTGQLWQMTLILRQGGAGSITVVWPAGTLWPGGTDPTLSTDVAAVDVFMLRTANAGTTVLATTVGQAFAA